MGRKKTGRKKRVKGFLPTKEAEKFIGLCHLIGIDSFEVLVRKIFNGMGNTDKARQDKVIKYVKRKNVVELAKLAHEKMYGTVTVESAIESLKYQIESEGRRTCRKGTPGCYCKIGWPYDEQCPDCRDDWNEGEFRDSYCICPPDEEKMKRLDELYKNK